MHRSKMFNETQHKNYEENCTKAQNNNNTQHKC